MLHKNPFIELIVGIIFIPGLVALITFIPMGFVFMNDAPIILKMWSCSGWLTFICAGISEMFYGPN